MNHHDALLHDLARDRLLSAARRRRTVRRLGNGLALATVVAAAAILALHNPATKAPAPAAAIPSPVINPAPAAPAEPALTCHQVESEDELLERLADLGPMLLTAADGSRHLILTRPH